MDAWYLANMYFAWTAPRTSQSSVPGVVIRCPGWNRWDLALYTCALMVVRDTAMQVAEGRTCHRETFRHTYSTDIWRTVPRLQVLAPLKGKSHGRFPLKMWIIMTTMLPHLVKKYLELRRVQEIPFLMHPWLNHPFRTIHNRRLLTFLSWPEVPGRPTSLQCPFTTHRQAGNSPRSPVIRLLRWWLHSTRMAIQCQEVRRTSLSRHRSPPRATFMQRTSLQVIVVIVDSHSTHLNGGLTTLPIIEDSRLNFLSN